VVYTKVVDAQTGEAVLRLPSDWNAGGNKLRIMYPGSGPSFWGGSAELVSLRKE
jgi:hypothetical protein